MASMTNTITFDAAIKNVAAQIASANSLGEKRGELTREISGHVLNAYAELIAFAAVYTPKPKERVFGRNGKIWKALEGLGTLSKGKIKRFADHSGHALKRLDGMADAAKTDGREGVLRVFATADIKTEAALIAQVAPGSKPDALANAIKKIASQDADDYAAALVKLAKAHADYIGEKAKEDAAKAAAAEKRDAAKAKAKADKEARAAA
jgi:hypothetical protein